MFQVKEQKCPVCQKQFSDDDDVVHCPVCGTPHHRDCYFLTGACANKALHGNGFTYQPEPVATQDEPVEIDTTSIQGQLRAKDIETVAAVTSSELKCSVCGTNNPNGTLFCEKCGKAFGKKEHTARSKPDNAPSQAAYDHFFDMGIVTPDEVIDDIPVKDWVTYIGSTSPYYLYHFKKQDSPTKRALSFPLTAAVLPSFYFLYRRMWFIAIIVIILEAILQVPMAINMYNNFADIPTSPVFSDIVYYSQTVSYILRILSGFFAVKLFRKSAGNKIKRLKKTSVKEEDYSSKLRKLSGPSKLVFGLVFAYLILEICVLSLLFV